MKKILLTNFNIVNLTGSEIDTITIAEYFINKGYEVDIFTLKKGKPIIDLVNPKIRVIVPNEDNMLYDKYDIIWSRHWALLDYILFYKKINANHVLYMSLSWFNSYEAFPDYYKDLSLIGTISNEILLKLKEELGKDSEKIYLFPNYVPTNYCKYAIKKPEKISKICIVSNHIPDELKEFIKMYKKSFIIDVYGFNYKIAYVDDKLLNKYDVVISIGKTIYYTTAMGIPSYCYDYLGGYGYITKDNINEAFKYNFSGRGFDQKKSPEEIYNELVKNFNKTQKDLEDIKQYANEKFNFENNMELILKQFTNKNKFNQQQLFKKFPLLFRKSELFVSAMNFANNEIDRLIIQQETIYNSTSWKITKPIRSIKKLFTKKGSE